MRAALRRDDAEIERRRHKARGGDRPSSQ
jgi:hypothetical protein